MTSSSGALFPFKWALLTALVVGAVYFLPQLFHLWHWQSHQLLLEENYDEISYAVWASRAAGEHVAQPDPYQISSRPTASFSFATVQFFPAWFIGQLARLTNLPATSLLMLGSFVLPAIIGFLFSYIVWLCDIKETSSIMSCVVFSLLMLPPVLWLMQFRYTMALLAGSDPGFHLSLSYSRRYQPQFTAVIHYLTIALSLALLRINRQKLFRGVIVLAGIGFGASFYCYYFSWTILLGWFVLGALVVRGQHPDKLKGWLFAALLGLIIAVPYFLSVMRNFSQVSQSAASAHTRVLPTDPAIWVTLMISAVLLGLMFFNREQRTRLWVPFVLNLVIALGALQNVLTGIFIQPYHYLHYFGRPAMNLAIAGLWLWVIQRWIRSSLLARYLQFAAIAGCLIVAVVFQCARYREVSSLGREAALAQAAMQAMRQYLPAGALVYCPDERAREAIPLYTNATSYFSRYMLLNETAATEAAIRERVVATRWLRGESEDDFSAWLKTKPIDVFFQQLQRPPNAESQLRMHSMEGDFQQLFRAWGNEPKLDVLEPLHYALLPKKLSLDATRLPQYFHCQLLWADEHYALFELGRL